MNELDDTLVTLLRDRADGPIPPSRLTAADVLARSRSAHRRSMVGRAAATVAVAALSTAGVLTAVALGRTPAPAPPADDDRTTTSARQTIEVAGGVLAVTEVTGFVLDDGSRAWDTGITEAWPPGDRVVMAGAGIQDETGTGASDGVAVWAASVDALVAEITAVTWLTDEADADPLVVPPPVVVQHPYTGQVLLLGMLPAGEPTPTVTLTLAADVTGPDGSPTRTIDVPTFPAPGVDGWVAFLVAFDRSVAPSVADGFGSSVADGPVTVVTDDCTGSVDRCPMPSAATATGGERTMCAEFPPVEPSGRGGSEGWWSSSPADADGNILTDPADWPPIVRDHPRTAVVDTRDLVVIETWDRYACGPVADYTLPTDISWPEAAVVVLDVDTGQIVEAFPRR